MNVWQGELSEPPRRVPLSVKLRLWSGGFTNQFGWVFFGFGMIFVWVFGGSLALHNLAFFNGALMETTGVVLNVAETNVSINDRTVYEYHYSYAVNDVEYEGANKGFGGVYDKGDEVPVEFPVDDHGRSRIKGLSTGSFGLMFVWIFPGVGLAFVAFGARKAIKGTRLLRHGVQTTGVLTSRESTNTKVNEQRVYKFTFEFMTEDKGVHEVTARTHVLDRFAGEDMGEVDEEAAETLKDTVAEPLLYIPDKPSEAMLLDDLPSGPRITEHGEITGSSGKLLPFLIIPAVSIVGHGYWFLHVLEIV